MTQPLVVDPRVGSGDLLGPLQELKVSAALGHLDYGDVQVIGRGPEERPVPIGVEIKKTSDLLDSIASKRFVGQRADGSPGQLHGLLQSYEIVYVLIEGVMTAGRSKELLVLKGNGTPRWETAGYSERRWQYDMVAGWKMSMEDCGVRFVETADRRATALWLAELWSRWQRPFDSHTSHRGIYQKPLRPLVTDDVFESYVVTRKMRVAAGMLPGLGFERCRALSDAFGSVEEMMAADEKKLREVPGIGKKFAKDFYDGVREVTK